MNIERLISMFIRLFMRKIMSRGIDAGIGLATRRGSGKTQDSGEDRETARAGKDLDTKDLAKKARKGARIIRRLGRM